MDVGWIANLAAEGATALVAAAATDAWQHARDGIRGIFARVDATDVVDSRLSHTAVQIERADGAEVEARRRRLSSQWEIRLADLLESHPEAEGELRTLIAELRSQLTMQQNTWLSGGMEIHAGRDAFTAGRDQMVIQRGDRDEPTMS